MNRYGQPESVKDTLNVIKILRPNGTSFVRSLRYVNTHHTLLTRLKMQIVGYTPTNVVASKPSIKVETISAESTGDLREQYKSLYGKYPGKNWGEETIKAKIASHGEE